MTRSLILAGVLVFGFTKAKAEAVQVGQKAPDFSAAAVQGAEAPRTLSLASLIGKTPIVLYFYPKDDTPGCTQEACGIRDQFAAFRKLNATVLGVSYDSIASHQKFIKKFNLPFTLISDADHRIAKAYGADGLLFAKRRTYVIDKTGKIAWMNPRVDPARHSQELQDVLAGLQ
jgi:peroxiredoxin Q/BCP